LKIRGYIVAAVLLVIASSTAASTYIDVQDDVYNILTKLDAEGLIPSSLLSTRPISLQEARRLLREAEQNVEGRSGFLKKLVRTLGARLARWEGDGPVVKPLEQATAAYIQASTDRRDLNYNNDGDHYQRGSNERLTLSARYDDRTRIGMVAEPEFRVPVLQEDPHRDEPVVLRKAYISAHAGVDFMVGAGLSWRAAADEQCRALHHDKGHESFARYAALDIQVSRPL
jgi:hypothetical protein